jgi:glutaredoxin
MTSLAFSLCHGLHKSIPVLTALLLASGWATPAYALYKIVGADGKITYTDRPVPLSENSNTVQNMGRSGTLTRDERRNTELPYELRQTAERYPVTLYTTEQCSPCNIARQLLRQRGIPYTEKTVNTVQDSAALHTNTGARDLPALTVGSQVLAGLQTSEWHSYLDTAGYPKESQLPARFSNGSAAPLTPPPKLVVSPPNAASAPEPKAPPPPETAPSGGKPKFQF